MLVDSLRIRWHSYLLKPLKCPTYTFIRSGRHFKSAPTDKNRLPSRISGYGKL